jgi:NADP-dependent 3-hydroxy acid dehydrogenase YdfG
MPETPSEFSNQIVFITGASRGIGAATARHMAGLGAQVVLVARSIQAIEAQAQHICQQGGHALALACDVADPHSVEQAVAQTRKVFGEVTVLVNNAGVIDPIAKLHQTDTDAWSRAVDVNIKGVYLASRAVIPAMLERGQGTIINISSGAAYSALEGWSAYCATKAAVLSLTRSLHKEYGDRGLRALGLSPGTVATAMQDRIRDSGINPVSRLKPSAHIPAEWVAQAIAYLCGPSGDTHLGTDFVLKTPEARSALGLPPP